MRNESSEEVYDAGLSPLSLSRHRPAASFMTTNSPISPPIPLGDILTPITQALPDDGHHPAPPWPSPVAPIPDLSTPPTPATPPAQDAPAYALFIALDWADDQHDVCVLDPVTQQRPQQRLEHNPTALHAWLADLHRRFPGRQLAVALEQQTGSLLTLPRDTLTGLRPDDPLPRQIRILTRKRRDAVNLRTQFSTWLNDLLKQDVPLFLQGCGEDLVAPLACRLLRDYPSFDALKQATPDTLRQFYVSHGCWKPAVIAQRLQVILDAEPLTTAAAIIQPAILDVTMLADLLLTVGDHIATWSRSTPMPPLLRACPAQARSSRLGCEPPSAQIGRASTRRGRGRPRPASRPSPSPAVRRGSCTGAQRARRFSARASRNTPMTRSATRSGRGPMIRGNGIAGKDIRPRCGPSRSRGFG